MVALVALLSGCKKGGDAMVGTWKLQLDPSLASKMPAGMKAPDVSVEFKDGGTFTASIAAAGKTQTAEGTYKLDGKALTMTTTKEDGTTKAPKDEAVTLSDDMKSFDLPGANGMGKMVKQ